MDFSTYVIVVPICLNIMSIVYVIKIDFPRKYIFLEIMGRGPTPIPDKKIGKQLLLKNMVRFATARKKEIH